MMKKSMFKIGTKVIYIGSTYFCPPKRKHKNPTFGFCRDGKTRPKGKILKTYNGNERFDVLFSGKLYETKKHQEFLAYCESKELKRIN